MVHSFLKCPSFTSESSPITEMPVSGTPSLLNFLAPGIAALFALAFYWTWWASDRNNRYILLFAIAVTLPIPAVALQIFKVYPSQGIAVITSGVVMMLAVLLAMEGLLRRYGRRIGVVFDLIILAATSYGMYHFWYVDPQFAIRAYLINVVPGLILILTAIRLWPLTRKRLIDRILVWTLLVSGVQLIPRTIILAASVPAETPSAYQSSLFWDVSTLATSVTVVALCIALLISIYSERMEELQHDRDFDRLTGVLNRRGFEDKVDHLFARRPLGTVSLVLCDLDHFKRINDTHGHAVGDEVLRRFGALLQGIGDERTLMGRIGGEEFAILFVAEEQPAARGLAVTIQSAIAATDFGLPHEAVPLSASFGIGWRRPGEGYVSLFERADEALYRAKSRGRNRVCVERPEPAPLLIDGAI